VAVCDRPQHRHRQAAGGGAIIPSQQVFDNAQVKGTAAGQKGQVVFLDPKAGI
jgi:iron complex transport system substrate-binding protein